jgi:ATP-dependent protease ClpP protease subunit
LFSQTDDPTVVELRITREHCIGPTQERFAQFRAAFASLSPSVSEIHVIINVLGGHANIGLGLHNLLLGWRGRVTTEIEQSAWSTGAFLAQAGSVRRMASDAVFGTHNCVLTVDDSVASNGIWTFPAKELRRLADLVDEMNEHCIRIFVERSGRTHQDVRALFDKDDCMTAQEALAWGAIDEITAPRGVRQDWPPHLWPKAKAAYERAGIRGLTEPAAI